MNRKIPIAKPNFGKEEETAVKEVLESGIIVQGPRIKSFEEEFANYIGVKYAVAVANGTVALDVALKALKLGAGDEIITSSFSFISSSNSILFQNSKPVFVDIDPKTFNIDPSDVAEKITAKTKALIPVHIFGQPAKMDALKEIEADVKEDAEQVRAESRLEPEPSHPVVQLDERSLHRIFRIILIPKHPHRRMEQRLIVSLIHLSKCIYVALPAPQNDRFFLHAVCRLL